MKNKELLNILKKIVIADPQPDYEIKVTKTVLAYLELSYMFYQSAHWQTKGTDFYGDHLLFQRLYEGIRDEVDTLGEKLVGVYGVEHVDLHRRITNLTTLANFLDIQYIQKEYISTALVMEKKLLGLLQEADTLNFSSGVKDMFAGFANAHEGNIYLLQQRQSVS